MPRIKLFGLAALVCAALAVRAGAEPSAVSSLIQQADHLYSVRTQTSGGKEALELYEKAIRVDPNSSEAFWKAARACYWIADTSDVKKEKILYFEKGIGLAKRAIELDPKSVDAHFWLGGLYGSYGETKGILKSLALVKPIRMEMETINRLDDKYQGGAGYRVLGIVDYKVPGFAGGSKKRALENLSKAIAIGPGNAFNQYYMAEFLDTAGPRDKAIEHLNALLALTPTADVDEPDLKKIQGKGRKLLKKLGN